MTCGVHYVFMLHENNKYIDIGLRSFRCNVNATHIYSPGPGKALFVCGGLFELNEMYSAVTVWPAVAGLSRNKEMLITWRCEQIRFPRMCTASRKQWYES